MRQYVGTKIVNAEPMTRSQYNIFRGWKLPEDENGDDKGFLVEYLDGGPPNTKSYAGYVSWSPAEVFDNSYHDSGNGLSFGEMLVLLKRGEKMSRIGWNGKNMYIALIPALSLLPNNDTTGKAKVNDRTAKHVGVKTPLEVQPYIAIFNDPNRWLPGWTATQSDMLAKDWVVS